MRTINANSKYITLGRQGENKVTEVIFDLTDWIEEIGNGGSFSLWHRPSGSNIKYPASISVVGGVISWLVTRTDTYISGRGQAEIIYVLNDKIAKTAIYETQVYPSLESITNGELTPDEEDYITRVIEYIEAHSDEASISEAVEKYMEEHPIDVVAEDEVKAIINSYKFYAKPNAGIPYVDLDIGVRRSLTRADNAILAETDPTVPSWAKQPTKPTYSYNELTDLPELPTGGGGTIHDTDVRMTDHFSDVTLNQALTEAISMIEDVALEAESKVSDVQINGVSITENGVADIQKASSSTLGVVATDTWNGTTIDAAGHIGLFASQETHLNNRTSNTAITPKNLDLALKIALTDGKASWTDTEKANARSLFGIDNNTADGMTFIDATADENMNLTFENYSEAWDTIVEKFPQVMLNVKVEVSGLEDYTIFEPMSKQVIGSTVAYMFGNTSVAVDEQSTLTTMVICMANTTMVQSLEFSGSGTSTDVQINGTSITQDGVANIPVATTNDYGVVRAGNSAFGINKNSSGVLYVANASDTEITARNSAYKPITPSNLDYAVKASLTDGKSSWTDAEKASARNLLGVTGTTGSTIDDVQVVGVSVVQNGVATIPAASTTEYGTVKLGGTNNGIGLGSIGQLYVARASDAEITAKSNGYKPIVPSNLDYAVKSGLADSKATWTDAEKTAARGLLGIGGDGSSVTDIQVNGVSVLSNGVANIPMGSTSNLGAVKAGTGVSVTDDGGLFIQSNWDSQLNDRANRTNQAVTLGFIDKSVTAVLTDGKAPALTEEQKKAAQDWLGVSDLIGGVEELIAEISEVVG